MKLCRRQGEKEVLRKKGGGEGRRVNESRRELLRGKFSRGGQWRGRRE